MIKKIILVLMIIVFITSCVEKTEKVTELEIKQNQLQNQLENPAEKNLLSLNFDEINMPNGLMPMGEMITHPLETNPRGHEGIDFTWDKKVPIYAFAGGEIVAIERSEGHPEEIWDIGVKTGKFLNSYTELESYNLNNSFLAIPRL